MTVNIRNLLQAVGFAAALIGGFGNANAGTTAKVKILEVQLSASALWIQLDTTVSPFSCTNFNGFVRRPLTGEYKQLLGMAVSAMLAGTEIRLRSDACDGVMPGDYPRIDVIRMFPAP